MWVLRAATQWALVQRGNSGRQSSCSKGMAHVDMERQCQKPWRLANYACQTRKWRAVIKRKPHTDMFVRSLFLPNLFNGERQSERKEAGALVKHPWGFLQPIMTVPEACQEGLVPIWIPLLYRPTYVLSRYYTITLVSLCL